MILRTVQCFLKILDKQSSVDWLSDNYCLNFNCTTSIAPKDNFLILTPATFYNNGLQ